MKKKKKIIQKPITIYSNRGKRIEGIIKCKNCGICKTGGWYYKESNHGEIIICSLCKQYKKGSFIKISFVAIESNRKKH